MLKNSIETLNVDFCIGKETGSTWKCEAVTKSFIICMCLHVY